jgi:hypothetical protein
MSDGYEGVRQLGLALSDLVTRGVSLGRTIRTEMRAGSERRYAERQARAAERKAKAQRKEWRELVERQKVHGEAGNASYAEAVEALSGTGGRPNPLDQRKF